MIAASAKIHPLSVIEDGAVIGENVVVGPFCHVGPKVVLHDGVELLTHAVVTGRTVIGRGTRIFANAVIGGDPQSLHHDGVETTLTVGENCTFREGVTVNTGTTGGGGKTVIGNNNLFLANSHVAHDCILGNNIVMSNSAMLAGHVIVEDRVILGGVSAVHQFTRLGYQSFIGGMTGVANDVIPYGMVTGIPGTLGGLNVVGMARAGMDKQLIHRVRRAFKQIFETEGAIRVNAAAIREEYADCAPVLQILDFIAADSDRALSAPSRSSKG
jgi:UDP-N-acetylglucosamine acyltransferase